VKTRFGSVASCDYARIACQDRGRWPDQGRARRDRVDMKFATCIACDFSPIRKPQKWVCNHISKDIRKGGQYRRSTRMRCGPTGVLRRMQAIVIRVTHRVQAAATAALNGRLSGSTASINFESRQVADDAETTPHSHGREMPYASLGRFCDSDASGCVQTS